MVPIKRKLSADWRGLREETPHILWRFSPCSLPSPSLEHSQGLPHWAWPDPAQNWNDPTHHKWHRSHLSHLHSHPHHHRSTAWRCTCLQSKQTDSTSRMNLGMTPGPAFVRFTTSLPSLHFQPQFRIFCTAPFSLPSFYVLKYSNTLQS